MVAVADGGQSDAVSDGCRTRRSYGMVGDDLADAIVAVDD